ncbi:DUF6431 domain-containing protein [Mycobacterium sp. THU-M104]|uniref:DUF6431 domain-containing protein n=1 Tax=Mycobacterium sp. THU-M104 TaxID=3410515 RepID=UPI003B9D00C8
MATTDRLIVARIAELAEDHLDAGTLHCPRCASRLAKWGFGRCRTIRSHGSTTVTLRPRRVRCSQCESTHIVLPTAFQARHGDTTEVIGQALLHKVNGLGYRRIAACIHRFESTVRRWLRRATPKHLCWMYRRGAQWLIEVAPAAYWDRHRLGLPDPPWAMVGIYTRDNRRARTPGVSLPALGERRESYSLGTVADPCSAHPAFGSSELGSLINIPAITFSTSKRNVLIRRVRYSPIIL